MLWSHFYIVESTDCRRERLSSTAWAERGRRFGRHSWIDATNVPPIFGTGKAVVLDSGFCVAKGIVALEVKCVFAGALIKKRRYWPKGVPGDLIDEHFENMDE